jgi:23S rRNA (uracil1939-C5)-methyltransferase
VSRRSRRQRLPQEAIEASVTGLSHEGRGIAHVNGETVFIDGALPGEQVSFRYLMRRRGIGEGAVVEVLEASPQRVEASCPHFGLCGGCSLQHLPPQGQLEMKQEFLRDQFERIGKVRPERWLPPLTGPIWGYRRRARLAVKHVPKKGGVLVGFRERYSPYVAALGGCEVLDPRVGRLLPELAQLIAGLSIVRQLPQIEVAIGDESAALVFRNLAPLTADDRQRLIEFGQRHGFQVYQQPGNESTIDLLWPSAAELTYRLPDFDVELAFLPVDFTQVNAEINRQMANRAIELLALEPEHRVLDLFCGLGNFTLPLARCAGYVVGVEGEAGLVERARGNARRNGLENCEFHVADLAGDVRDLPWMRQRYQRILLDPPRSGAGALIPQIGALGAERIVYVSCGPATLARDAGLLAEQGYKLRAAGVMDMFPHTAHVESIALFER